MVLELWTKFGSDICYSHWSRSTHLCSRHSFDDVTRINFQFRLLVTWSYPHGCHAYSCQIWCSRLFNPEILTFFPQNSRWRTPPSCFLDFWVVRFLPPGLCVQHSLQQRLHVFTLFVPLSSCLPCCPVTTWTRPQVELVHYTHAPAEESNDRKRSLALYLKS